MVGPMVGLDRKLPSPSCGPPARGGIQFIAYRMKGLISLETTLPLIPSIPSMLLASSLARCGACGVPCSQFCILTPSPAFVAHGFVAF